MTSTSRAILIRSAILGALTVGLGAFGAHGLKDVIAKVPRGPEYWETGVRYALAHSAALVGLAAHAKHAMGTGLHRAAGHCWFAGSLVFAGTLMLLALGAPKWFGAITPLGGAALLVGWVLVGVAAWRGEEK